VRAGDRDAERTEAEQASRRRLVDLIGAEVDLSSLVDDKDRDPESIIRVTDMYAALESAMSQLSVRDRLLIKLRFEDALAMPDVAVTLGFPTRFHAYRRLREVLERLRRGLEAQGFVEAAP
jgi:DNA-directed RNA polymerase specialized sigma subunit